MISRTGPRPRPPADPASSIASLCLAGIAALSAAAAATADVRDAGDEGPPFGPTLVVEAASLPPRAPDMSKHVGSLPGVDVVDNGPLAGQVQYRGLFGPRVNVQVNGTRTNPGGPEWMDAHLHYVPAPLLDEIELQRGISPVSAGAESLGAVVRARTKRTRFLDIPHESDAGAHTSVDWTPQVDVEIAGRSVDGAFAGGGLVGAANHHQRFHVLGSHESGNDYDARPGTIRPTRHARTQYGLAYGFRHRGHELAIDYRHNDTGATGSPALGLDTIFFDTELLDASYRLQAGATTLLARVDWIDVDHRMDNFSLRPQAGSPLFSDAQGHAIGYSLDASHPLAGGVLQVGVDGQATRYGMGVSTTLDPAFFLDAFEAVSRDRVGAWGEWRGEAPGGIQARLGVRYTRVSMSAGPVDTTLALIPQIRRLRDAFNSADRDRSDNLVDWALELAVEPGDALRLSLGAARKERSPSHLERYLWVPLEVSAGLADGNNYVGDLTLKPEVSHEVDGGFEWRRGPCRVAPRAFYRHVDDFIQGTPATNRDVIVISVGQGNANPLQFSNVEAEFYGVDLDWGTSLPLGLVLDGTLSYVRGRRRDVDDDLYRLSPFHGRVTLTWLGPLRSSAAVESVFAAGQDRVSVTNRETPTDAWGVLNLRASWEPLEGVDLIVGLDNVVDSDVRHHLAGVNRALGSAIGPGEKLPGTGRSVYGRARWRW